MNAARRLKRSMDTLKHLLRDAVRKGYAERGTGNPNTIQLASKQNLVTTRNLGQKQAMGAASSNQTIHIRQDGETSYEKSVEAKRTVGR